MQRVTENISKITVVTTSTRRNLWEIRSASPDKAPQRYIPESVSCFKLSWYGLCMLCALRQITLDKDVHRTVCIGWKVILRVPIWRSKLSASTYVFPCSRCKAHSSILTAELRLRERERERERAVIHLIQQAARDGLLLHLLYFFHSTNRTAGFQSWRRSQLRVVMYSSRLKSIHIHCSTLVHIPLSAELI